MEVGTFLTSQKQTCRYEVGVCLRISARIMALKSATWVCREDSGKKFVNEHGNSGEEEEEVVWTEYGCEFWASIGVDVNEWESDLGKNRVVKVGQQSDQTAVALQIKTLNWIG